MDLNGKIRLITEILTHDEFVLDNDNLELFNLNFQKVNSNPDQPNHAKFEKIHSDQIDDEFKSKIRSNSIFEASNHHNSISKIQKPTNNLISNTNIKRKLNANRSLIIDKTPKNV